MPPTVGVEKRDGVQVHQVLKEKYPDAEVIADALDEADREEDADCNLGSDAIVDEGRS